MKTKTTILCGLALLALLALGPTVRADGLLPGELDTPVLDWPEEDDLFDDGVPADLGLLQMTVQARLAADRNLIGLCDEIIRMHQCPTFTIPMYVPAPAYPTYVPPRWGTNGASFWPVYPPVYNPQPLWRGSSFHIQ
jgi:hypothetical protein